MFEIFSKSKIKPSHNGPVSEFACTPGLEDARRIALIINDALQTAEDESELFKSRIEQAVGRAAVSLGNGTDEYLERETLNTLHLNLFDAEIRDRSVYLAQLGRNIENFKKLNEMLLAAFPEVAKNIIGRPGAVRLQG
jgi:hypothetical protein